MAIKKTRWSFILILALLMTVALLVYGIIFFQNKDAKYKITAGMIKSLNEISKKDSAKVTTEIKNQINELSMQIQGMQFLQKEFDKSIAFYTILIAVLTVLLSLTLTIFSKSEIDEKTANLERSFEEKNKTLKEKTEALEEKNRTEAEKINSQFHEMEKKQLELLELIMGTNILFLQSQKDHISVIKISISAISLLSITKSSVLGNTIKVLESELKLLNTDISKITNKSEFKDIGKKFEKIKILDDKDMEKTIELKKLYYSILSKIE